MIQVNTVHVGSKYLYLLFIGDLHIGNKYCLYNKLDYLIQFIEKYRGNVRIVLMGDLLEAATKTSVGRGVYDESFPLQKQFEFLVKLLGNYSEYITLVVEGNHEERIIKDTSFEITQEMCHRLGCHNFYAGYQGVANYRLCDGLTYSVFGWHGSTRGATDSSAVNGLLDMRKRITSHIYAMGHTHKLFSFKKGHYLPNPSGEIIKIEQMFINTGTCLGYGGYGEQKGYDVNFTGLGGVLMHSGRRKMEFFDISDMV